MSQKSSIAQGAKIVSQALMSDKKEIKLYSFKTSDFKGVLATRAKRGTGTAAKKTAAKKTK